MRAIVFPPPAAPPYKTSCSLEARNSVCGPMFGEKTTSWVFFFSSIVSKSKLLVGSTISGCNLFKSFLASVRRRFASVCLRFAAAIFFSAVVFGLFFFRVLAISFRRLDGLSVSLPRKRFHIRLSPWWVRLSPVLLTSHSATLRELLPSSR